jgi:hypothetical protein
MLRLSLVSVDVTCVLVGVLWYCASSLEVRSPVLLAFWSGGRGIPVLTTYAFGAVSFFF